MDDQRGEQEPPIYLPGWYDRLKRKGRHVLEIRGRFTMRLTWESVQLDRRNQRRFFTGKYRAESPIQAASMVIGGFFLLVLCALFIAIVLAHPDMKTTSSQRSLIFWVILLTGMVGPFSFINGIASIMERSWRYDRDEFSYKWGVEEPHALTALVGGEWRTAKPYLILLQLVGGTAFILPMILTIIELYEYTSGISPNLGRDGLDNRLFLNSFYFASLMLLPLFLFGGGMVINSLLNLWRLARGEFKTEKKRRDRD